MIQRKHSKQCKQKYKSEGEVMNVNEAIKF